MLHKSLLSRTEALRYVFWGFWFFLVPAVAAYGLITWLSAAELVGPFDEAARDQSVPAGIVAFTLFEAVLWYFRHHLPFSAPFSAGGRAGVPAELRRDYESATHLVDEAERVIGRHEKDVAVHLGQTRLRELREAVEALSASLKAEPFDRERFAEAHSRAAQLTSEGLAPWRKGELREYAESIGIAILVALLLRAVVIEAFKIPSGSMKPTLQIGDHIFVSKFAYGPKLPLLDTRVFGDLPPRRGDVIVFEYPDPNLDHERQDFIKRVVAIPGDTLTIEAGRPVINGWHVPSCRVGRYSHAEPAGFGRTSGDLFVEFLEGTAYLALYDVHDADEKQGPYQVQPGEVWVMGDNRDNSLDSRAWRRTNGSQGAGVPYDNIKGRAMIIWFPAGRMLINVMGEPQLPDGAPDELIRNVERCLASAPPLAETMPPSAPQGQAALR